MVGTSVTSRKERKFEFVQNTRKFTLCSGHFDEVICGNNYFPRSQAIGECRRTHLQRESLNFLRSISSQYLLQLLDNKLLRLGHMSHTEYFDGTSKNLVSFIIVSPVL